MMFGYISPWGLAIWSNGTASPLWRAVATIENMWLVNGLSAIVVAASFAFVIKKLLFTLGPLDNPDTSTKAAKMTPYLTWIPFFVVPAFAESICGLSPFFFSLMPSALALAILVSINETFVVPTDDEMEIPVPRLLWLRLLLSGVCAAIGTWEGTTGLVLSVVMFALIFLPCINRDLPIARLTGLWFLGFAAAFVTEGICLGWDWGALLPVRPPVVGLIVFFVLAILPVAAVRTLGEKRWILLVWGILLAIFATVTLTDGHYWKLSASERFVHRVLQELGERKLILGDGVFNDYFKALKPADVKFVGTESNEDREFLIHFFDDREPVAKRALVVRHYYRLPEAEEGLAEHGLMLNKPEVKTAKQPAKSGKGVELETPNLPRVAEVTKEMRALAATNELRRIVRQAQPLMKSLDEMLVDFGKIPVEQRRAKVEEARSNIRKAWQQGFGGTKLSSTLLSLDILLGDWEGAESDALMALVIERDDPAANGLLGNIRLRKNKFEEAERYLRKGVKGEGAGVYNDLAMLLLLTKRLPEAEKWARKAVAKDPKNWNFQDTLMQILSKSGKSDEAIEVRKTCRRLKMEEEDRRDAARFEGLKRARRESRRR